MTLIIIAILCILAAIGLPVLGALTSAVGWLLGVAIVLAAIIITPIAIGFVIGKLTNKKGGKE